MENYFASKTVTTHIRMSYLYRYKCTLLNVLDGARHLSICINHYFTKISFSFLFLSLQAGRYILTDPVAEASRMKDGRLSLAPRMRLGAVHCGIVFALGFFGAEFRQNFRRGGNVVPAAVGEVDEGLTAPVDRDDAADAAVEPFQLGANRVDLYELIGPFGLERFNLGSGRSDHVWQSQAVDT